MTPAPSTANEDSERARARAFVESHGGEPCDTDFFSFARWVEGLLPRMPRIGCSRRLNEDPLLFHQTTYLEFAPSTVQRVRALPLRESGGPVGKMEGYFLGLLGPSGPMPLALTEYVWSRSHGVPHPDRITPAANVQVSIHRRDSSLEDFFNIFNHRFISFFYRAWASCRKAVDFDRPAEAKFPNYIGSFVGLGMESLRGRLEVPDEAVMYFSGHFANRSRHAQGLAAIASDYFKTSAVVVENVGHWLEVPETDRCMLGSLSSTALGAGIVLGARLWDRQLRFTLKLGPMSLDSYEKMFPGGLALEALRSFVKLYTNRGLYCGAQIILAKEDFGGSKLGGGCRLGFSTWLYNSPPPNDLDDLRIELQ